MQALYMEKVSRMVIPLSRNACSSSRGCSRQLEIAWSASDSSFTPYSSGQNRGMNFKLLGHCGSSPTHTEIWVNTQKGYNTRGMHW